jgi:hypothetical protein
MIPREASSFKISPLTPTQRNDITHPWSPPSDSDLQLDPYSDFDDLKNYKNKERNLQPPKPFFKHNDLRHESNI